MYRINKINQVLLIITTVISISFFYACQKVINVTLDEGTPQLAVDAFISNNRTTQIIRLTKTAAYFNNAKATPATGAIVRITDNQNNIYNFFDVNNDGNYTWTPAATDTLVRTFTQYNLSITYNGETYFANSTAFPVPPIDSIRYREEKGKPGTPKGYYPAFYAIDIPGMTNFYWVRSYKNSVRYNEPSLITLSQDGAFNGNGADGFLFILPIRENIIPRNKPLELGDSIGVELISINEDTYSFLTQVQTQTQNGGLFATPPANVSSNIKNTTSSTKAVGFFNVGMIATNGIRVN